MSTPVIQPSFAAGELSPSMYGRTDLAKYHSGVALARNFFVDYRGGLTSRAGTGFVGQCKDSTQANRLIPFTFSILQTYILVFGDHSMRVVMDGSYVTEPTKPINTVTATDPGVFNVTGHGYSNGDLVYLNGFLDPTIFLEERFGTVTVIDANNFSLVDLYGQPISTDGITAGSIGGYVGRIFTLTTPYAGADLALLKFCQSADVMSLTHPSYAPQQLTRSQHWVWTLTVMNFAPTNQPPASVTTTPSSSGGTTYKYVVTAVAENGITESIASAVASVASVQLSNTSGSSNTTKWTGHPGDTLYNVYRTAEVPGGAPPSGALFGYIGAVAPAAINSFIDDNIAPDFTRTPPQANNPFAVGQIESVSVTLGGNTYTAPTLTITDPTGSGAILVPIVAGGVITSVVVMNGGQNYTNPSVGCSDSTGSGASFGAPVLSGPNNPICSTYYQQRQVYGGQSNAPDAIVFSKSGDFQNLTYSTPQRADDVIQVTLGSTTVNPIKHMVPLNSLVVLTGAGAWRVDGGSQSDAVTPSNIYAVPQAYTGASDVVPIVINYDVLYVGSNGSTVRDLSYNFYINVYTGVDISMLSNHLFYGHKVIEWAWAEDPFKVVWAVREDGIMLSLTFLKEQEVYGWCRHDTQGLVKSVCSIREGTESAVYMIVERQVNGQTLQYVERMASRYLGGDAAIGIPSDPELAWCVDCGLRNALAGRAANLTPASAAGIPQVQTSFVIAGGANYTAPVLSVQDPTGAGAVLLPTVSGGVITGVSVLSPGENYTNPTVTITDATGSGAVIGLSIARPVVMNASLQVFTQADIGAVVRINGGSGTVLSVPSASQIVVDVRRPLTSQWPAAFGAWTITQPLTTVTGLDHLNGCTVSILADGGVQPQQTVVNGSITLQHPASLVTVGLPFTGQVKSLYLDVPEGAQTIQSKRKKIGAVTARVADTRGLRIGTDFNNLVDMKQRATEAMGQATELYTGDLRTVINPLWNVQGQICLELTDPLPATLLALIPEPAIGDT
jgi:hypothetical protein